jgi:hypothetical protein
MELNLMRNIYCDFEPLQGSVVVLCFFPMRCMGYSY